MVIYIRLTGSGTGSANVTATLTDSSSNLVTKTITVPLSTTQVSHYIIVPLIPIPTSFPLDVKVKANATTGIILLSPVELILDQPIYVGCFDMEAGEHLKEVESALDCLVHCHENSKRFGVLTKGNQCSCLPEINHDKFTQLANSRCNLHCTASSALKCGGPNVFSVYVASELLFN